ncbi:MAG: methyl-accepting chemotaxis protein [Elusimicrobia bacterium]|nr:methyl-accepting chemotaxis protein [Elusimicrobiota bacterium]
MKTRTIRRELLGMVAILVVVPLLATMSLLYLQKRHIQQLVKDNEMGHIVTGILDLCQAGVNTPDGQARVRQILLAKKLGSGYAYVLGGHGDKRGVYIVSKDGVRDGENIWESKDLGGNHFIQDIVNSALEAPPGKVIRSQRYPWKNPDDKAMRYKLAYAAYFKPWDWVVGLSLYEDEYDMGTVRSLNQTVLLVLVVGAVIGLAAIFWGMRVADSLSRPLSNIIAIAGVVAKGDLGAADVRLQAAARLLPARDGRGPGADGNGSRSEIDQLTYSVYEMTNRLKSLIGQSQSSIVQLLSTATEIAATAKQEEATMNGLGASTTEIAASVNQISATAQELVNTMNQVTSVSEETAGLATEGGSSLGVMEASIRDLADATKSISAKLAEINDKASNITAVMTTITKIADQTNLLSLNAAIEAEKAGEHGLGFGVVAREIRRLADQTAVSTLDIEHMIKEMQSSASSGVMEMDKFSEVMKSGIAQIQGLGGQMAQIISRVERLQPQFQMVREGMQSQSNGAKQINEAMGMLTETTHNTMESIKEFNQAVAAMHAAMQGLKDEISKFKIAA